jgi:hypothetical protein
LGESLLSFIKNRIPCDHHGFGDDFALPAITEASNRNGTLMGFDAGTIQEMTQKSLKSNLIGAMKK